MYWHRLLLSSQGLWPAALVWATLVLPYIAMESHQLREAIDPMPWWMRSGLWAVEHTWPYSRMADMALRWNTRLRRYEQVGPRFGPHCWCQDAYQGGLEVPSHSPAVPHCAVCHLWLGALSSGKREAHLLQHFPGEDSAWQEGMWRWQNVPPRFESLEQAQAWLDVRTPTGVGSSELTSVGSTSTSPRA